MSEERITYDEFMIMFKFAPKMCYTLYDKAEDEIERLNNIINELEKEIISQIEICKEGQVLEAKVRSPFDTYSGDIRAYKYLLYKLKELKENNKDDK